MAARIQALNAWSASVGVGLATCIIVTTGVGAYLLVRDLQSRGDFIIDLRTKLQESLKCELYLKPLAGVDLLWVRWLDAKQVWHEAPHPFQDCSEALMNDDRFAVYYHEDDPGRIVQCAGGSGILLPSCRWGRRKPVPWVGMVVLLSILPVLLGICVGLLRPPQ